MTSDAALDRLLKIQERTVALFLDRRVERDPGEPTRIQAFVLQSITRRPGLSISELADMLHVSAPSASQLVNTMMDRGWVSVKVSPQDRRRHELNLTSCGSHVLAERTDKRLSRVRAVLEQLSPLERAQLVQLMDRVATLWQSTEGRSENDR